MLSKFVVSRVVKTFVVALTIPLLSGCVVEQRLSWSPDGKKMAIVGADGLRVSLDSGIHLADPVDVDAQSVAWFPDSKRVALVTKANCENWAELEKSVDKEEVEAIKAGAAQMLKQLELCGGDFAVCRDALMKENFNSTYVQPVLYYLRSTAQDNMQRLVGREWKDMKTMDAFVCISHIKVYEVDASGKLQLKQTLASTANTFESIKVSPSNEFICLVDKDKNLCLVQTTATAKGYRRIASKFAKQPDWDFNTDVIYGLHSVVRTDKKGSSEAQELVSVDARKGGTLKRLSWAETTNGKVRSTVDGNLIFGSFVSLPASKKAKAQNADALSVLNLTSGKSKRVFVAAGGDRLESFEVSPDGKKISITNTNGAVKIVSLPAGTYKVVVPGVAKNERDVFTPVWKNNDEICYERLATKDGSGQVALLSLSTNKSKDISLKWPAEAVRGLLNDPKKGSKLSFEDMIKDLEEHKRANLKS